MLLAAGFFASGWPERVKAHPYWVLAMFVVGAIMFLVPAFESVLPRVQEYLYSVTVDSPPLVPVSKVETPISNETTVSPNISPIFAPVINVSPVISATISPNQSNIQIPPPAPIEKPVAPPLEKPSIDLVDLQIDPGMPNISYDDLQACWKENNFDGNPALILWVMNPVAPVGSSGRPTPAIAAHLTLKAKDGSNTTIPRAYWVNVQENEVVLDVGHRAGVIVGYIEHTVWVSPENPHRFSPFANPVFAVPFCPVGPRHVVSRATPISVGLAIISTGDGKTLVHKKFEIHFTAKGVTVMALP
jgi:hypothetical protein